MTFALFILYVVLSYIHPAQIVPELAPYRFTYWVGLAGLAAASPSLLGERSGLLANLQLWGLIVLTGVMSLSLMLSEGWMGAPLVTLERFGPSVTMFVLAICSVTSLARLRVAVGCVVGLTLVLMLQGAAAYHLGVNERLFLLDRSTRSDAPEVALAEDEAAAPEDPEQVPEDVLDDRDREGSSRIRALGFMHDPNDLAMGLIVALGLIGGAWRRELGGRRLFLAAAATGLVYGLHLTGSRGGAVALLAMLGMDAAGRLGRVPALVLVAALGAVALAFGVGGRSLSMELDASASERLVAWTEGFEMLKAQPLLGVGYGQFLEYHPLTAHNSLVLSFAETGLFGTFFWVGLLVVTWLELHRTKQLPGDEQFDESAKRWAHGLQLALVGFMASALFLSRTFVPTLYLVIGLSVALSTIARAADRPIPLPGLPTLASLVIACEIAGIGVIYTIVKLQAG
jgi:hypothetical protein